MLTYNDWEKVVSEFFNDYMGSLTVVELGKGEGTRFLTKNFAKVHSIEYTRYPFTASWESTTEGLPNHTLETITPISNLLDLDTILVNSLGNTRPQELKEEANRLHTAALNYDSDILFIDHGCHNRGEVLELAKKAKWKYIIVHDTNFPYYGYNLNTQKDFYVYHSLVGQGTAIFERKRNTNFLSVIIPTVGRKSLLHSLDSLLLQTNPNWVAHVGFDGIPICPIKEDPRIKLYSLEKTGEGPNYGGQVRNVLIKKSKSPWICFLDDDDSFRKDYVESFYQENNKHPEADVIIFRMSFDPEDVRVLPLKVDPLFQQGNVGISFAVRRDFLYKHGLWFENNYIEDYSFLERIKNKGGIIIFSEHIVYNVDF